MRSAVSGASDISEAFNKLSQEVIDKFIAIRESNGDASSIQVILNRMSKRYTAPDDIAFFRDHAFQVLSMGNTLNIQIRSLVSNDIKVFGIAIPIADNQFLPDDVRLPLAEQGVIAQKYLQTTHNTRGYNFRLTDFYPNGSFNKLYEKSRLSPATLHQDCSVNILKMAEKLQVLQRDQVFFSDAKVTNWLLDSNNNPVIADEKSLRTFEQAKEMKGSFVRTPGYWPPGVITLKTSEDFEKIHAYILGANIYDYLTCSQPPSRTIRDDIDFRTKVFQGEIGQRYKRLILNLTNPDASKRLGLEDATKELEQIHSDITLGAQQRRVLKARAPQVTQPQTIEATEPETIELKKEQTIQLTQKMLAIKPAESNREDLIKLYSHVKDPLPNRCLAYNANVNVLKGSFPFKYRYQAFKGDQLKAEILINLKSRIDYVTTKDELYALKIEIMGDKKTGRHKSPEFKILEKHQGLISNVFKKSTSHQALETLFAEKEASLSSTAVPTTRK